MLPLWSSTLPGPTVQRTERVLLAAENCALGIEHWSDPGSDAEHWILPSFLKGAGLLPVDDVGHVNRFGDHCFFYTAESATICDERLHQPVDADPACSDRASHRGEPRLLRGLGDAEIGQDAHGAIAVVFLDRRMYVVEVERGLRNSVVLFQRLRHAPDVRSIDRLRRDVTAAERLDRARALEREQFVLLDDGRRQIVGVEHFIAREAERFAQPHEENRVAGLRAADGVLAAFFDHERDERALPLEVLPRRRSAADRDNLPRSVPERVEEERALLADDVADLIARELAVPDRVEQRMVQPRMRVLRLLQELSCELGGRKHHRSPFGSSMQYGIIVLASPDRG